MSKFMNVLLIGSGGRENALAMAISKSKMLNTLYIAPGNPGTALFGTNVDLIIKDFNAVEKFVIENEITTIVVGPEAPLVDGIADHFNKYEKILVIGPSKQGAQLEGSKAFSKKFMQRHQIPTAAYFECNAGSLQEGIEFLNTLTPPYVLKADGLASGKGVLIIDHLEEAIVELSEMLKGKFGKASATVVIETFLSGMEFSVFALTDGKEFVLLPEAKDYKRIGEGDTGLNTGGMGAISPVPFYDATMRKKVIDKIITPTIKGLNEENISYNGFVFFGLINVDDEPFVIEYNCRMGDPETEVVIPRIESDFLELLECTRNHSLSSYKMDIMQETAATVMLVSEGYPGDYASNREITINEILPDSIAFHSGTKIQNDKLLTSGGRVMTVTSFGSDIEEALAKSYTSIENISFEGMYYRGDIGQDLL